MKKKNLEYEKYSCASCMSRIGEGIDASIRNLEYVLERYDDAIPYGLQGDIRDLMRCLEDVNEKLTDITNQI